MSYLYGTQESRRTIFSTASHGLGASIQHVRGPHDGAAGFTSTTTTPNNLEISNIQTNKSYQ